MSFEVTAINPADGKIKKLEPTELAELLAVLADFDNALRREITISKSGGVLELSAYNRYPETSRERRMVCIKLGEVEKKKKKKK